MWSLIAAAALMATSAPPTADPSAATQPQWLGTITLTRSRLHDPARWSDRERATRASHFNYWQRLTKAGSVILVGRTLDEDAKGRLAVDAVGLIIFEAPDRASAERIMAGDPGVKGGLWRYKLNRYRVALQR